MSGLITSARPLVARLSRGYDKRYNIYVLFGSVGYSEVYGRYGIAFTTFMCLTAVDLLDSGLAAPPTINRINCVLYYNHKTVRKSIQWLLDNNYLSMETRNNPKRRGRPSRCYYLTQLGKQVISVFNTTMDKAINECQYKD